MSRAVSISHARHSATDLLNGKALLDQHSARVSYVLIYVRQANENWEDASVAPRTVSLLEPIVITVFPAVSWRSPEF